MQPDHLIEVWGRIFWAGDVDVGLGEIAEPRLGVAAEHLPVGVVLGLELGRDEVEGEGVAVARGDLEVCGEVDADIAHQRIRAVDGA